MSAQRPTLQSSRSNDDWSFLATTPSAEFWDKLKFVRLNKSGSSYLTLGGEARETYELFRNAGFGAGPQNDNGYLLQRYRLSFDYHSDSFRGFIELNRSSVEGRRSGARPSDENRTDFYQAFAEVRPGLRLGRQELFFGSGRLLALKEGSNVPISFDGVRGSFAKSDWHIDLFAARPVTTSFGSFDDTSSNNQRIWGAYLVRSSQSTVEAYYISRDRDSAKYAQGEGHEVRHSFGIRSAGRSGHFARDYELIYQTGSFRGDPISAYRISLDSYYEVPSALKWKLGLRLDKGSGDGNPSDHELHTFDGLFQSGNYSGKPGLLGPANEYDIEPSIACMPSKNCSASAAVGFLWRDSDSDATYQINGTPDRVSADKSRYVGSRTTVNFTWQASPHLSYNVNYIYVVPGPYYRHSGAHANETYLALWATYRF